MTEKLNSHRNFPIWLITILALLLLGCSLSGQLASLRGEPDFLPTRTPLPTYTPTVMGENFIGFEDGQSQESVALNSATLEPTAEVVEPTPAPVEPTAASTEPTVEPTTAPEESTEADTASSESGDTTVTITIVQDMNVRGGPGTNYPVIGPGPAGATSNVVGRNSDNSWLQVEYPPGSGGTGWLYTELVQVAGNPENVAVAQVEAPPPAAAPAEQAPQPAEPAPPPAPSYQFTPTGWHASENAAIVHFKGRIHDEFGNLVNGYSVYVTNGSWGTVSHPTGGSVWYPDKGDGEWDVSGINLGQGQGWWFLSVVRYDCNFAAAFDAQCKNFTTLSEEIPVEVRNP